MQSQQTQQTMVQTLPIRIKVKSFTDGTSLGPYEADGGKHEARVMHEFLAASEKRLNAPHNEHTLVEAHQIILRSSPPLSPSRDEAGFEYVGQESCPSPATIEFPSPKSEEWDVELLERGGVDLVQAPYFCQASERASSYYGEVDV